MTDPRTLLYHCLDPTEYKVDVWLQAGGGGFWRVRVTHRETGVSWRNSSNRNRSVFRAVKEAHRVCRKRVRVQRAYAILGITKEDIDAATPPLGESTRHAGQGGRV